MNNMYNSYWSDEFSLYLRNYILKFDVILTVHRR